MCSATYALKLTYNYCLHVVYWAYSFVESLPRYAKGSDMSGVAKGPIELSPIPFSVGFPLVKVCGIVGESRFTLPCILMIVKHQKSR